MLKFPDEKWTGLARGRCRRRHWAMPSDAPGAPWAQSAASEIADHHAQCAVCRLPLFGAGRQSSRNGARVLSATNVTGETTR